jgi:pimeloyl-ACP methyl ester carboxylesterase
MSDSAPSNQTVAAAQAVTLAGNPVYVCYAQRALPNLTILIHGVNDLGEAYDAQEQGICTGLNERLNRKSSLTEAGGDLQANHYNTNYAELLKEADTAAKRKKLEFNPDAVLYRRSEDSASYSPVIPFYWGSREDAEVDPDSNLPKYINTTAKHGEWTDRFGNRIDKDGAKGGGPFTNATTNLPDMFGPGFSKTPLKGDPTHPLLPGPGRRYMVLAAKRLAMLIKMIRSNPETAKAAINIVAHSQGCMVSLLAHAFLADEGFTKVADCVILNHPPYSFEETFLEWEFQKGGDMETTQARLQTLINITGFMTGTVAADPPLSILKDSPTGVTGEYWQPGSGAKKWHAADGKEYTFDERDNRGKVYLYFCMNDATVGLKNVQGMGWKGIPDVVYAQPPGRPVAADGSVPIEALDAFKVLKTKRFYQRIFTSRKRDGKPVAVGLEPQEYTLKKFLEHVELPSIWYGNVSGAMSTSDVGLYEKRTINGEALNPPCVPVLTYGESTEHPKQLLVSEIDARIALTYGGIGKVNLTQPDPLAGQRRGEQVQGGYDLRDEMLRLQAEYDAAHTDPQDSATILHVYSDGRNLHITRSESPREARERWTTKKYNDNSYHSSIVANPMHSAQVTAYDLALGQPLEPTKTLKGYVNFLCKVADWRTDWAAIEKNASETNEALIQFMAKESPATKTLVADAAKYYDTGILPDHITGCAIPKLVVNQTLKQRMNNA